MSNYAPLICTPDPLVVLCYCPGTGSGDTNDRCITGVRWELQHTFGEWKMCKIWSLGVRWPSNSRGIVMTYGLRMRKLSVT